MRDTSRTRERAAQRVSYFKRLVKLMNLQLIQKKGEIQSAKIRNEEGIELSEQIILKSRGPLGNTSKLIFPKARKPTRNAYISNAFYLQN